MSSLSQAEVARTGTIALCKWARLMVTTPRALAYGYPWLDSINHELVHYAVSIADRGQAPVWLQEGLAKFLERRWREPPGGRIPPAMEHLLAKALRSGRLISFEAMHPSMAKLPSAEDATLAFAEVANAIAYLHEKGGMAALRDAIKRVAAGEDARAGGRGGRRRLMARVRTRLEGVHGRAELQDLPGHRHPDHPHPQAGRDRVGAKTGRGGRAVGQLKAGAPYRHLRLGNMLMQRERPRAAAAEYEKGAKAGRATNRRATTRRRPGCSRSSSGARTSRWASPTRRSRRWAACATLYPDLPWPNLITGEALLAKGTPRAAMEPLRASLGTNPFDPRVHCALAEAYAKVPGCRAARPKRPSRASSSSAKSCTGTDSLAQRPTARGPSSRFASIVAINERRDVPSPSPRS